MIPPALQKRRQGNLFLRFAIVGTIGFLTDGGLLQAGLWLGLSPLWARAPSFSVAVLVTWYLNRNFTFRTPEKTFRESFPAYLASNAVGLGINVAVYTAGVMMRAMPLLALAIASIAAMFFNFAMAKFVVFKNKS